MHIAQSAPLLPSTVQPIWLNALCIVHTRNKFAVTHVLYSCASLTTIYLCKLG